MIKFFERPSKWILGCDPGPEHSAFALVKCDDATHKPSVEAVSYVSNANVAALSCESLWNYLTGYGSGESFAPIRGSHITYAFERCSVQAGGANAMVFETCMTAGELRYMVGSNPHCRMHSFSPSEWRYMLTGKGCANDANVRAVLLTLVPECDTILRSYSKKAKKMYELKKPITSHLRDAVGVALATGFVNYRKGLTLDQFPARLEVHCG